MWPPKRQNRQFLSWLILTNCSNVLKKATHGSKFSSSVLQFNCTPALTALLLVHLWIQCLCDLLNRDITFVSQISRVNNEITIMSESSIMCLWVQMKKQVNLANGLSIWPKRNCAMFTAFYDWVDTLLTFRDCDRCSAPTLKTYPNQWHK